MLKPVVARYQGKVSRIYFRADAGFANPEVYDFLEAERIKYAIRLPANRVLQERIGYLLNRPSLDVRVSYANFTYQAGTWTKSPRWNGIRANFIRASASSSPTCRGLPKMSSPTTTSAALLCLRQVGNCLRHSVEKIGHGAAIYSERSKGLFNGGSAIGGLSASIAMAIARP